MQHGTVSSADRLSQGVIAWPQVRRIPMKTSCKVPIWASSIGPSRHALLAGGLLGHGTSGEIVAASSRLGPIELELFGGGIWPARVQKRGARRIPSCGNVVSLKRCDTAGECKVPIWASSIGPSRHALLAGGLLGQQALAARARPSPGAREHGHGTCAAKSTVKK